MKEVKREYDIHIVEVENGFQIVFVNYQPGFLGFTRSKNREYVAETPEKLKEVLDKFVDEITEVK